MEAIGINNRGFISQTLSYKCFCDGNCHIKNSKRRKHANKFSIRKIKYKDAHGAIFIEWIHAICSDIYVLNACFATNNTKCVGYGVKYSQGNYG